MPLEAPVTTAKGRVDGVIGLLPSGKVSPHSEEQSAYRMRRDLVRLAASFGRTGQAAPFAFDDDGLAPPVEFGTFLHRTSFFVQPLIVASQFCEFLIANCFEMSVPALKRRGNFFGCH